MSRKSGITIILSTILLLIVLGALAIYVGVTNKKIEEYKQELNYTYQNNFYSLVDGVNNIENDLSKLSITNSKDMQEKYLTEVVSLCDSCQNNLSNLPIQHSSIENTYKFVNQLGGYCFVLHQDVLSGKSLTEEQSSKLKELHLSSKKIKTELNEMSKLINSGYSIVDNISNPEVRTNNFSQNLNSIYDETIEYPSLIYDGPFSDSVENKEIKGLSQNKISQTEAEEKVKDWFDGFEISFDGTTNGHFETFNFSLSKNDVSGFVQITQNDGLILSFFSDESSRKNNKSILECEFLAQEFLTKLGFENTTVVWSQDAQNYVYINFCFAQNDVIIYPDMIKVKVCRESGNVVGLEAQSYAYNHIKRSQEFLTSSKTVDEARENLDKKLEEISVRLCVVPNEYIGESLCYEFKCFYDDEIYYVYLSAQTAEEERVLKVIQTDDGNLLM